jgi:uncharacterized protein (TIGR03083 family)
VTVLELARDERLALADLLADLTPEQWEHDTLCTGWTVRDVAAHTMSFEGVGLGALVRRFVRGRLQTDRINELALADLAGLSTTELVAMIRTHAVPAGLGAAAGGRAALTDNMIHQQDIRRPLGMPRTIGAEALTTALDFARRSPLLRGGRRTRGVRLVASDLEWTAGKGPEVCGPGEALLMVMTGRAAALADLSGPGVEGLAARL